MKAVVCEHAALVRLDVLACGICGSDLHARHHSDEMADAGRTRGRRHE